MQLTDNGFYECSADNGFDKPLKKIFRIVVNGMTCFQSLHAIIGILYTKVVYSTSRNGQKTQGYEDFNHEVWVGY